MLLVFICNKKAFDIERYLDPMLFERGFLAWVAIFFLNLRLYSPMKRFQDYLVFM
jgi:hypothetical protein